MKIIVDMMVLFITIINFSPKELCYGNQLNIYRDEAEIKGYLNQNDVIINIDGQEFVKEDLNGDGNSEIIAAYKSEDIENAIFLLILDEKNNKRFNIKCDGSKLELLNFYDINGDGKKEVIFGGYMSEDYNKLSVFSLKEVQMQKEFTYTYSRIEILNNEMSDKNIPMALWVREEGGCYKVLVAVWNGSELVEEKGLTKKYYKKVADYYKERTLDETDNPFLWYHLAEAQMKIGDKKGAYESISKGVALNKDKPTKQQFDELKRMK